ncbi:MAG: aminoacyl-tRNA hydrolase [Dehalococcoidales bacterium]|nr:aminoacyl-tRNA hydrolase [Dehalococcoidales bacterium]
MFFWKKKLSYRLIVGLGNPGERYARNRHNIGFMCIENYAEKYGIRINKKQATSRIGTGEILGYDVIIAMPETFMNRSGLAVNRLRQKHQVRRENIIVIHDDLDLPPGRIRIRPVGSSAGHKGITSVIDHLGRNDFARIRVGIGRPAGTDESTGVADADIVAYVLGDLTPEDEETFREVIPRVGEAIDLILTEGLQAAMNKYNQ